MELKHFVCDRTTHPTIEKLQSKHVAMYTYGVSVYWKSIKWIWVEPFEMNVKIEQGLNFILDNESHFFFDALEA